MMPLQNLWLFIGTGLIFSALPGPAVLQVSAQGIRGGFGAAMAAVLGILTGSALYIVVGALGLGALIAASATAFAVIKVAGAAYLILLGIWTIWRARDAGERPGRPGKPFRQALLTQICNPKAVLFFGAFMPQFLDRSQTLWPQYAEMFVIVMMWEALVLGAYGWLASRGGQWMLGGLPERRAQISGAVFIVIGIIFAASQRA